MVWSVGDYYRLRTLNAVRKSWSLIELKGSSPKRTFDEKTYPRLRPNRCMRVSVGGPEE